MTWVQTLQTLRSFGESDAQNIIKRFNQEPPKESQLLAQKARAVRNLLDVFPPQALQLVKDHVQQFGWSNCCFSDDCLSSKKLLPQFNWRHGSKGKWPEWSKVSEQSCQLMLRRAITQFVNTDEDKRKKLSRQELEVLAEQATFAVGVSGPSC